MTVSLDDEHEHTFVDSADHEILESQLQQLASVMHTITAEETRMLQLKYEDGLDIRAIAQQFALKDSAVKMRLKRTRDKIRRLYSEQYS
ncbi:RNA polymerase sigma factor (sigma-70 family) [Spirosoma sp. LMG 31448]|uniref:RNA polymerase sigma factor (Sigma-70 family) n=3 Tax=Spirosoma utsteinense TaxID=2585773 RepID=A0ABR6WAX0_9BACT|nr:RNA polymerase sigma factor (sigma-70 family) [Spirosoma utsteinense]MBC3793704.1 RNA polymerase sigma factor (sigma-70 family) [Spirosoma utsteinense]